MIAKTKEYEIFKFREDNRENIDYAHVNRLICSIKSRNLLDLRPIVVNEDMEIIDGQHRLLAAKQLGLDIYYQQQRNLGSAEVLLMNTTKAWTAGDFLNFYCKNNYVEYIKLKDFMLKHALSLRVALNITMGQGNYSYLDYKNGKYKFEDLGFSDYIDICWETIGVIKKLNGFSSFTSSSRFWGALIKLVSHHNFEASKWRDNLPKMIQRVNAKATTNDYCHMLMEIYNWRNQDKINIMDI